MTFTAYEDLRALNEHSLISIKTFFCTIDVQVVASVISCVQTLFSQSYIDNIPALNYWRNLAQRFIDILC